MNLHSRFALGSWIICLIVGSNLVASAAKAPRESADELFSTHAIPHLSIEIPEAGLEILRKYAWRGAGSEKTRESVPATVREKDRVYTNVVLHLKGAAGSFRPVDDKPGLTLHFDGQVKGQLFHGLFKISLNNSVQDPTFITDKLCRELFLQTGVPVPRCDYATVELNGRPLGLYVLSEGWDKKLIKHHFKPPFGEFYSPSGAGDLDKLMVGGEGKPPADASKFVKTCQVAMNTDIAQRVNQLRLLVDLDRFVTMLALDAMIWNWDGYGMNKNNYRVYDDRAAGRLVFMPTGLDQEFAKPNGPVLTGYNGVVARGFLQTAEGRKMTLDRFRQLYPRQFNVTALTNRVMELAARISPTFAAQNASVASQHNRAVTILCHRIAERCRNIEEQLASLEKAVPIAVNQTVTLGGWKPRSITGTPALDKDPQDGSLHINAQQNGAAAWFTVVWLEEGTYTLKGRIKTAGVIAGGNRPVPGAGLRVFSTRKFATGWNWSWFPYHESDDLVHRGEVEPKNFQATRLVGTQGWTEVAYEIELHQPMADLEILCELSANSGEAWFDPQSIRLTRNTDICP